MKKKLRDMVIGEEFLNSASERLVVGVIDTSGKNRHVDILTNYEYEMVEPEPEWLYECIDTGNCGYKVSELATNQEIENNSNYRKIKGGRKMHPETFEIVD